MNISCQNTRGEDRTSAMASDMASVAPSTPFHPASGIIRSSQLNRRKTLLALAALPAIAILLTACGSGGGGAGASTPPSGEDGHDHAAESTPASSNRVAIPPAVRSNLGITFVRVERRAIERTLRVPGRFEYVPTARREYRTALAGRVELLVDQYQAIEAGTPLYRIDSPAWREMQQQLSEAGTTIRRLDARQGTFEPLRLAHERHHEILEQSVAVWQERVEQLRTVNEAGGGRGDEMAQARASLATTMADLAEVEEREAELQAQRDETKAELESALARLGFLLDSASAVVGRERGWLVEQVETPAGDQPRWATIRTIEVRAAEPGIVDDINLTNGSWADQTMATLSVVRPDRLRFRAAGLQSDLGVLRDGLAARIVPPTPTSAGRAVPLQDTMEGTLTIGLAGDPHDRTLDLIVTPAALRTWARPGVTAQLEIVIDGSSTADLAIPLAAVQRDGLTPIIFRRDPTNPNQAIRMEADLGKDDGRWVALLSGVRDADEVVLDGAFQLMLATSGSIQKGGHFHSDGTFHQGEDGEGH